MSEEIADYSAEDIQLVNAYRKVFLGSPEGKLVFWDLMNEGYVFRPYGIHNASAYAMEGKRAYALRILQLVEFSLPVGVGPTATNIKDIQAVLEEASRFTKNEVEEIKDE